jgi:hypothetical protein
VVPRDTANATTAAAKKTAAMPAAPKNVKKK